MSSGRQPAAGRQRNWWADIHPGQEVDDRKALAAALHTAADSFYSPAPSSRSTPAKAKANSNGKPTKAASTPKGRA
jgi:hypothetical protein